MRLCSLTTLSITPHAIRRTACGHRAYCTRTLFLALKQALPVFITALQHNWGRRVCWRWMNVRQAMDLLHRGAVVVRGKPNSESQLRRVTLEIGSTTHKLLQYYLFNALPCCQALFAVTKPMLLNRQLVHTLTQDQTTLWLNADGKPPVSDTGGGMEAALKKILGVEMTQTTMRAVVVNVLGEAKLAGRLTDAEHAHAIATLGHTPAVSDKAYRSVSDEGPRESAAAFARMDLGQQILRAGKHLKPARDGQAPPGQHAEQLQAILEQLQALAGVRGADSRPPCGCKIRANCSKCNPCPHGRRRAACGECGSPEVCPCGCQRNKCDKHKYVFLCTLSACGTLCLSGVRSSAPRNAVCPRAPYPEPERFAPQESLRLRVRDHDGV